MEIAVYLSILLVGFSIGFSIKTWLVRHRKYGGVIHVERRDEKIVYTLELEDYPETIMFKKEVAFRVDVSEIEIDRK